MKIGVIAGTPVDTRMGVDYILSKGLEAVGFNCSPDPVAQNELQVLHKEELLQIATEGCLDMVRRGAEGIFMNCNSLAGAIDIERLKANVPVFTVTPLDIYRMSAMQYSSLSVIAANGQSLAAIEKVILAANPDCGVFGAGLLPLVLAIEAAVPPAEIYRKLKLKSLTDSFAAIGCDALILGCTHFPYVAAEIAAGFPAPVIDPSESMLQLLKENR